MVEGKKVILPVKGERNILISSALPYVNNTPHLGNIIGSVLSADVFSRYSKGRGYNTLYICGTDEYGTATETKAIEEGVTPRELCDKFNKIHADVYKWFDIAFDHFGRTSTQEQTDISQEIFLKLHKNGYLEEKTTKQPYCQTHNSFLADRFVEGECPLCHYEDARGDQCDKCGHLLDPLELINPKCKLDGATPVVRETKHFYLSLDKLQPAEEEWFKKSSTEGRWSTNGIQITSSWLKEGLHARGITRDLKWGTKLPAEVGSDYDDKVMYVWFDACIGYVSITATYTEEWRQWWHNPEQVKLYQFMGKDNTPFHTVVFPSTQLGTGDNWTMLNTISTTEYLNYEKGKFSKSRGIGVFGTDAEKTQISSDVWRYYLLSHRPETGDTEFEWTGFISANNNELLKNLGNLVNRVVKFVSSKVYNSVVPDYTKYTDEKLDAHVTKANEILKQYIEELEDVKLRAGLATAMHLSSLGNLLLQDNKLDNKLATEQPEQCAAVVGLALSHIHLVVSLIQPYMPKTATSILEQLNASLLPIPDTWETSTRTIPVGHTIGTPGLLFSVIKPEKEQQWREEFGGAEARKAKDEAAAKAAAKKAEKERKKLAKLAKKTGGDVEASAVGKGVEAAEKGGPAATKTAVEEVAEGVHQVTLQSS